MVSYFFGGGSAQQVPETFLQEDSQSTEVDKYQGLDEQSFNFGQQQISGKYVFLSKRYIYAMVAPKPVTDGHVLICTTSSKAHLKDLNELEVLELFVTAKEIAKKFEETYGIKNFMYLMQDGPNSGQNSIEEEDGKRKSAGDRNQFTYLQLIPIAEKNTKTLAEQFSQASSQKEQAFKEERTKDYRQLFESITQAALM